VNNKLLSLNVSKFYKEPKTTHNIRGSIVVILAEDEINVKSKITCNSNSDNLTGFCGAKVDHHYVSNFLLVGIRKS
jgi:hypothetical protein